MRICILGATGLVGRETLELIGRAWPDAQLFLYASRDKLLELGDRNLDVHAASRLEADDAPRGDLALVALDDEHSRRYVPRLLQLGYKVVDKSNTYRLDPQVPLVVAGVNCGRVGPDAQLVANPNCTTIPLTLAVGPLMRKWGLRSLTVSTYQAISGAGIGALDDFLSEAKRGYEVTDRLGLQFDPGHYAANTVPHAGKTDETGFSSEERKLLLESRKILADPKLAISAQCCRVPVAVGHYLNTWIELGTAVDPNEIEALLGDADQAPYLHLFPGASGEGMSALQCVHHRDAALVGRLRRDGRDDVGRSFCLTVAADNLRLGAATNAVRIASRWFPSRDRELQAPGVG